MTADVRPGIPFWIDQADSAGVRREGAALSEDLDTQVCVVGGGFLGLWTAIEIKRRDPDRDVVLIEAARCGDGASGRNGGFVMSWWSKFTALAARLGTEEALDLARASARVPTEISTFCDEHDLDVGLRTRGWLWVASNAPQVGAWEGVAEQLEQLGERPFIRMTREESRARSGSGLVEGGVYEETCAVLQPAFLVAGLVDVARKLGVRIFEHSPMTEIRRGARQTVVAGRREIKADKVVLALGAWTAQHQPSVRRSLVIVSSDMVATEPAGSELDRCGMPSGVAISDSRLMVNYLHRTTDDRIALGTAGGGLAFGSFPSQRFVSGAPRESTVEQNLRRFYPELTAGISHAWTGAVERSLSGIPFVMRQGGVISAAGFSGNGVGPSKVVAKVLASLALETDDRWSCSGLVSEPDNGFPPEPIRYLGGALVRRAVARKERAEDRNRKPDFVTDRLASLAPAGLVPATSD